MKKENSEFLSKKEIIERLKVQDQLVVDTIYETCQKQLSFEDQRRSGLDSKSNNLAGMIGVYLTILFGIWGVFLNNSNFFILVGSLWFKIFYLVIIIMAFIALSFAMLTSRVRSDYRTIGERDIFNSNMIKKGINLYKRYLCAHYWRIYRINYNINEKKGEKLKLSYIFLFFTVLSLTLLASFLIIHLPEKGVSIMHVNQNNGDSEPEDIPIEKELNTGAEESEATDTPSEGEPLTEGESFSPNILNHSNGGADASEETEMPSEGETHTAAEEPEETETPSDGESTTQGQ